MSNEDLPQSAELASAYLDGELDGPDRAAAGADPSVMSAVDSFARVRAALGDVDPVDPATKNAAIAAALAEFDALRSTSPPAGEPAGAVVAPVVSLQSRRHRAFRLVTGAAAAAIVGVVAIGALNSSDGNDDSVSLATAAPAIASAESAPELKSVAADAGAATEAAPAATEEASAGGAADAASRAAPVIETTDALRAYAASMQARRHHCGAGAGRHAPRLPRPMPRTHRSPEASQRSLASAPTRSSSAQSSTEARRQSPSATL